MGWGGRGQRKSIETNSFLNFFGDFGLLAAMKCVKLWMRLFGYHLIACLNTQFLKRINRNDVSRAMRSLSLQMLHFTVFYLK